MDMVCVYCGSPTKVTNSRRQRQSIGVWRRRQCTKCGAIFTSREQADLQESLRVANDTKHKHLSPFMRDQLFLDIYESCKHRPTALGDAASLTQTIIDSIVTAADRGIVERDMIVATAQRVLQRFDAAAATFYAAYHPAKGQQN